MLKNISGRNSINNMSNDRFTKTQSNHCNKISIFISLLFLVLQTFYEIHTTNGDVIK
ncbi:MAG: hypothetical protein IKC84_00905 [Helicobacteraceae bacterium]|nr:hypothetical protein [Helicobacteraceae bacterium]